VEELRRDSARPGFHGDHEQRLVHGLDQVARGVERLDERLLGAAGRERHRDSARMQIGRDAADLAKPVAYGGLGVTGLQVAGRPGGDAQRHRVEDREPPEARADRVRAHDRVVRARGGRRWQHGRDLRQGERRLQPALDEAGERLFVASRWELALTDSNTARAGVDERHEVGGEVRARG
jgi:hypothetical protein